MTKNEKQALVIDLEIIEEKLNNTMEYLKSLKNYFNKELEKCRRRKNMNE